MVAGAGFAGLNTALELARRGFEVELIDSKGFHEFTPGAADVVSGKEDPENLRLDLADFLAKTPIDFTREKIIHIDPGKSVVETNSGAHSYENLVVALGYDVETFGIDVSGAETAYSLEGAEDLSEKAEEADDGTVIGAGYVGVEIASELKESGVETDLVDQATRPMPRASEEVSEKVLDQLNSREISFRGGREVKDIDGDSVVYGSGEVEESDLVVWAAGMQASKLVQRAFDCGKEGIPVNGGLNSKEYENVFAAGASADVESQETARVAIKQAETIAENIGRDEDESLDEFEPPKNIFVITVDDGAIMEYGDKVFTGRLFRYLKRIARTRYWLKLYWKKIRTGF